MPYSSYDHDKLETAETMRIERRIYFEAKDGEIAPYVSLPPEQLHAMREESAAAEQAIFNDTREKLREAASQEEVERIKREEELKQELVDREKEIQAKQEVDHKRRMALLRRGLER